MRGKQLFNQNPMVRGSLVKPGTSRQLKKATTKSPLLNPGEQAGQKASMKQHARSQQRKPPRSAETPVGSLAKGGGEVVGPTDQ